MKRNKGLLAGLIILILVVLKAFVRIGLFQINDVSLLVTTFNLKQRMLAFVILILLLIVLLEIIVALILKIIVQRLNQILATRSSFLRILYAFVLLIATAVLIVSTLNSESFLSFYLLWNLAQVLLGLHFTVLAIAFKSTVPSLFMTISGLVTLIDSFNQLAGLSFNYYIWPLSFVSEVVFGGWLIFYFQKHIYD